MAFHHSPNIVTDDLQFYVDAANTKSYPGSGTSWYDLSENNNTATLSTPTYTSAGVKSMLFDANGDEAYATELTVPATGAFTVEFMYKITNTVGRGGLFERRPTSTFNGMSLGQGGSNIWAFTVSDNYTNGTLQADFSYPSINVWYHDVGIFNGTNTVYGYRNGALVDTTTGVTVGNLDSAGARDKLKIMKRDTNSSTVLGSVACVRVYHKALAAAEVAQNYQALRRRFGL